MVTKATIAFLRFLAGRVSRTELRPESVSSILLVELSRLGDVITVLTSIPHLKQVFPSARIILVTDQKYTGFVSSVDSGIEAKGFANTDTPAGLRVATQWARTFPADVSCSMSPGKRNAIVALSGKAKRKVGYLAYVDTHTPFLSSRSVEAYGIAVKENLSFSLESISERPLKVLKALGVKHPSPGGRLALKPDSLAEAKKTLEAASIAPHHPYVVIHPFSGWQFRTWPAENFTRLGKALLKEGWSNIVFVCDREESFKLDQFRQDFKGNARVFFFASPDVTATAALMQDCSLFIGNDSGPLHLAAAFGAQCVGLFGPAWPELTAPAGMKGATVYKQLECSPCEQRTCVRPENPCMHLITPEEVLESVRKVRTLSEPQTAHA